MTDVLAASNCHGSPVTYIVNSGNRAMWKVKKAIFTKMQLLENHVNGFPEQQSNM